MKPLLRVALLLCFILVGIALVVPQPGLTLMEQEFAWLGIGVGWLKTVVPGWDLDHLVAFGLLGFTAGLAFPRLRGGHVLGALILFAGLTEIAQIWVPGRTASARDAALDVAGGLLGYVLARALGFAGRRVSAPARARGSRQ
jgi:hypothetical protein